MSRAATPWKVKMKVDLTRLNLNLERRNSRVYLCPKCDVVALSSNLQRQHIRSTHSVEGQKSTSSPSVEQRREPVKCYKPGCKFRANSDKIFIRHVKQKHGYPCRLCQYVPVSVEALNFHAASQHCVQCPDCSYRTTCPDAVDQHMQTEHTGRYCCADCGFSATKLSVFKQHFILHYPHSTAAKREQGSRLTCGKCGFRAPGYILLQNHIILNHVLECTHCDYCSFSKYSLSRHKAEAHSIHICSKCDFTAEAIRELDEHKNTVHGSPRLKCKLCSYQAPTPLDLKHHGRTLHGNRRSCDYCRFATSVQNRMRRHYVSKHKEKLVSCQYCDFVTHRPGNLVAHQARCPLNPFEFFCSSCLFGARSKGELISHKRDIHGWALKAGKETLRKKRREREKRNIERSCWVPGEQGDKDEGHEVFGHLLQNEPGVYVVPQPVPEADSADDDKEDPGTLGETLTEPTEQQYLEFRCTECGFIAETETSFVNHLTSELCAYLSAPP